MAKVTPGDHTPTGGTGKPADQIKGDAKAFNLSPPKTIPNNLGKMKQEFPDMFGRFMKALIQGIAMKIMRDMRKHAKLKKEG